MIKLPNSIHLSEAVQDTQRTPTFFKSGGIFDPAAHANGDFVAVSRERCASKASAPDLKNVDEKGRLLGWAIGEADRLSRDGKAVTQASPSVSFERRRAAPSFVMTRDAVASLEAKRLAALGVCWRHL